MSKKFSNNYWKNPCCRLCESTRLKKVIDLGKSPLANSFYRKIKKNILYVPLAVEFCQNCFHLQLSHIVNPKKMFQNYLYVSGTSKVTKKHFRIYAEDIKKIFRHKRKVKILEIASNDGTFIKNFRSKKYTALGIDPAKNLNEAFKDNKIKIITGFFSEQTSNKIKKKYHNFDAIVANNVFAHVDNLIGFSKGVKNILSKEGIFVLEVSYLIDVLKKNTFDTIYHEHMSFHSYYSLNKFFRNLGMRIFNFKLSKVQGGSIRLYICHQNSKYKNDPKLSHLQNHEISNLKINKIKTYRDMQKKILEMKYRIQKNINSNINEGKVLVGYGAAAKTTTLLNFFKINNKHFQFIVDDNPLKQNRFTPGTNIPIKSPKFIYENKVDYIYILSWNFYKSIISKHKKLLKQGKKFINLYR